MDSLSKQRVLITAGPTREPIDPVRYISNYSSGKMGFALARAARDVGAEVTLISGPVELETPSHIQRVNVTTAVDMYEKVLGSLEQCDIFIATAAVCDYRCVTVLKHKLKKQAHSTMTLELIANPDILATVAAWDPSPFTVGFAAETENMLEYASEKLTQKKVNMMIGNWVGLAHQGFESDQNAVTALWQGGQRAFPLMQKEVLATALIQLIGERYASKNTT